MSPTCSLSRNPFPTSCTYLFHPLHYRHRYCLRQSGWSTCVCHFRPPGFPAYVPPRRLVGPVFPVVVPKCLACLVLLTRSVMMRFPFLICVSLPPLSLLLPRLLTVMTKLPFRVLLLWSRVMVMLRFLSRTPVFLAFPPPPPLQLFALDLSFRLLADALSGMVNSDFLLLLRLSSSSPISILLPSHMNASTSLQNFHKRLIMQQGSTVPSCAHSFII
jgi:hypothetical protein